VGKPRILGRESLTTDSTDGGKTLAWENGDYRKASGKEKFECDLGKGRLLD
jgi:hypothetical protein